MATKIRLRTLTVFLAKPDVSQEELLDLRTRGAVRTTIALSPSTHGELHTYTSSRQHPPWTRLFGSTIDPAALGLWSSSASGVLVISRGPRLFALTFGYGRHAVRPEAVEGTFGLRVALNVLPEDAIRSVDRKSFEGITTHIREQASKATRLTAFGINADRDLLRAIIGVPSEHAWGRRIAGMDALSITLPIDLAGIPPLLDRCLAESQNTYYQRRYPWIDNIQEVRDPSIIKTLQKTLAAMVARGDFSRKWLSVPDILEWEKIDGFRYGRNNKSTLLDDIHLSTYTKSIRSPSTLTWERMSQHRVRCFSPGGTQAIHEWPLTYCIYAEMDHGGHCYILNAGSWYQLDQGYVTRLDQDLASLRETSTTLVPYHSHESEAEYNQRLSRKIANSCVMDAKPIRFGGGHSSVEFCDVLSNKNVLYHVKRYRGSSVLSHLFAQGLVSATALVSDAEFRTKLNAKLPKPFRFSNIATRPNGSDYEVAYVVASRSSAQLVLPFFSRVTLRNARQQLQALGFRVTLTKVGII